MLTQVVTVAKSCADHDRTAAHEREGHSIVYLAVEAVGYSETEFDLLCSASTWFRRNSGLGLTPRQVPIEGLHAKRSGSTRTGRSSIHFPPVPKAVAVEGVGFGGAPAIASFDWLTAAPHLIHWGDLDPAGFEIVDRFRQAGLPVRTILMDLPTYEEYERFGTSTDARRIALGTPVRQDLPRLTDSERAVYDKLTARLQFASMSAMPGRSLPCAARSWRG